MDYNGEDCFLWLASLFIGIIAGSSMILVSLLVLVSKPKYFPYISSHGMDSRVHYCRTITSKGEMGCIFCGMITMHQTNSDSIITLDQSGHGQPGRNSSQLLFVIKIGHVHWANTCRLESNNHIII